MRQRFHQNNQELYYAVAPYAWWGLTGKLLTKNNLQQDGLPTLKEIQAYNNNRSFYNESKGYCNNYDYKKKLFGMFRK